LEPGLPGQGNGIVPGRTNHPGSDRNKSFGAEPCLPYITWLLPFKPPPKTASTPVSEILAPSGGNRYKAPTISKAAEISLSLICLQLKLGYEQPPKFSCGKRPLNGIESLK
jgi:hypothetical protein